MRVGFQIRMVLPFQRDEFGKLMLWEAVRFELFSVVVACIDQLLEVRSASRQRIPHSFVRIETRVTGRHGGKVPIQLHIHETRTVELRKHVCAENLVIESQDSRPDGDSQNAVEIHTEIVEAVIVLVEVSPVIRGEVARVTETDDC